MQLQRGSRRIDVRDITSRFLHSYKYVSYIPAHEVIAATDIVVKHRDLQLVRLVVVHVQVELFQPSWTQRLCLVLHVTTPTISHTLNFTCLSDIIIIIIIIICSFEYI